MKKYLSPEVKILSIDTKDICTASMIVAEQFRTEVDPHARDIDNW